MYSNISQILLLYKTWGHYNKFEPSRSLGVCYWCVEISKCGYMGHGLKLIIFYVQKHIAALEMCHNQPLVRDKLLGAPAFVKLVYSQHFFAMFHLPISIMKMSPYHIRWSYAHHIIIMGNFLYLEISVTVNYRYSRYKSIWNLDR